MLVNYVVAPESSTSTGFSLLFNWLSSGFFTIVDNLFTNSHTIESIDTAILKLEMCIARGTDINPGAQLKIKSLNLKKIYPVIKDKDIICHITDEYGLCFRNSLVFRDNFMNKNDNNISSSIKSSFNGLKDDYEMNGGLQSFQCKELEVFQLI